MPDDIIDLLEWIESRVHEELGTALGSIFWRNWKWQLIRNPSLLTRIV